MHPEQLPPQRHSSSITSVRRGACVVDRRHSGALVLWISTGERGLFWGRVLLRCACVQSSVTRAWFGEQVALKSTNRTLLMQLLFEEWNNKTLVLPSFARLWINNKRKITFKHYQEAQVRSSNPRYTRHGAPAERRWVHKNTQSSKQTQSLCRESADRCWFWGRTRVDIWNMTLH